VGTVHGQDIVEIVPVGGEIKQTTSPGFIAKPNYDPITTRFLYSKTVKDRSEKWSSSVDSRAAPSYQDWHSRSSAAGSGIYPVVHWKGGHPVRYLGSSTRGTEIFFDAVKVVDAPGNVHGACIRRRSDGEWVVRCVYGSSATPITIAEADLSFSQDDRKFSAGAWTTIDTIDVSSLFSGLDSGSQPRLAFWNSSGNGFLFWAKHTSGKFVFARADVAEIESGFSVSSTILGESPLVTMVVSRTAADACLAYFTTVNPSCDNKLCYHWTSTYTAVASSSLSDGIIACDWNVDSVVFMKAEIDGEPKQTEEVSESEYGNPSEWGSPIPTTFKAEKTTYSCNLPGGYGSWSVSIGSPARSIWLPTLSGIINGTAIEFIKNDIVLQSVTDNYREENVYARAGAGCYAETYGGGDGRTCTKPNRSILGDKEIRSLAFLDLRYGVCATITSKTNKESSVETKTFTGANCESISFSSSKASTKSGEKRILRKGVDVISSLYESTSTASSGSSLDNGMPDAWSNMREGVVGSSSATRYVTILDFLGPSTFVQGATNRDGDALISSEPVSGSELLAISYLNKEDPKTVAGLGSAAFLTEIAAVGS
jgi:hypothetical protein